MEPAANTCQTNLEKPPVRVYCAEHQSPLSITYASTLVSAGHFKKHQQDEAQMAANALQPW